MESCENGLHLSRPVIDALLDSNGVVGRLLLALLVYHKHNNIDEQEAIEVSLTQLATLGRMHRQSVIRAIEKAEKQDLIRVDRCSTGNKYYFNLPICEK
ncbi:MAG: hypothetical protein R6V19_03935 [Armatimonadota bacterium]